MSPTFAQLVSEVAGKTQLTKLTTRRVLETFFGELSEATWATGRVAVPGLGLFQVRARKPRLIIDPQRPGAHLTVPAFRSVRALVAKSWRRRG